MMRVSRAEILEVQSTRILKVIRATIDPRITTNYMGDMSPHPGNIATVIQMGDDPDDLVVVALDDGVERTSQPGERRIYSYDPDGNVLASIALNQDSEVVINEGGDWAVQFTEMKAAFDELKTDFNNFVTSTYNTHIHTTTATIKATDVLGVIATTTSTGTETSADMTGAKIEKVRVPATTSTGTETGADMVGVP
jgi:hypothetical protein